MQREDCCIIARHTIQIYMSSYIMQNSSGWTNHRSINHVCSLLLNKSRMSLTSSAKRKESVSQNCIVVPIVWQTQSVTGVKGILTFLPVTSQSIYPQGPMSLSHALQPKDISVSWSIYPNTQGLPVILPYSSLGAMIPQ